MKTIFSQKDTAPLRKPTERCVFYLLHFQRANMTLVETIVFLADFISADRTYSGVEHMREKAYRDLYDAVVEGLAFTIADLASHRAPVHPDTVAAFNQILLQHGSHKKGKSL